MKKQRLAFLSGNCTPQQETEEKTPRPSPEYTQVTFTRNFQQNLFRRDTHKAH